MKSFVLFLAISCLALSLQAQDSGLFDSVMAQAGMTAADIGFNQDEMATWGGDRWRLSYFTLYHHQPLRLPTHAELTLEELRANAADPDGLLAFAGRRIDAPIRRGLIGDPLEKYLPVEDSLSPYSITEKRMALIGKEYEALRDGIDLFYRVVDDDDGLFHRAIDDIDENKYREELWKYFVQDSSVYADFVEELYGRTDFNRLIAGSEDLTSALSRLADTLPYLQFPDRIVKIETDQGNIYVGTAGDDEYEYLYAPLLIIDGGGNDTYHFIRGHNSEYPVAAIIDLAGDDTYSTDDTTKPGIGGAVLGYSMLIDMAGNDRYESSHVSMGAGIFGVGMLIDKSGDDIYSAKNIAQGAGLFGVGVLADSSGNDSLYCWTMAQGFGFSRGCGLLVNGEGADRYVAEDDTLLSASSQTEDHNTSLAQGVGFGRRADFVDGHSWAGGIGILCDAAGDDSYSAGLFAQGCAYWFSVGMLLDGGGADRYNGVWYVQGSGAHFGVGYLDDFGGNDTYTATHNMAVGAGHDFTIGYLNERGGDDVYTVPNLSLGGGNANGIGIFVDHAGDDTYNTKQGTTTLGRANSLDRGIRGRLAVMGIFIDAAGNDIYTEDWAGNNMKWLGPPSDPDNPNPKAIGVGWDR